MAGLVIIGMPAIAGFGAGTIAGVLLPPKIAFAVGCVGMMVSSVMIYKKPPGGANTGKIYLFLIFILNLNS